MHFDFVNVPSSQIKCKLSDTKQRGNGNVVYEEEQTN